MTPDPVRCEPEDDPRPPSRYDQRQIEAVLVTCEKCKQPFFMTQPQKVCLACR